MVRLSTQTIMIFLILCLCISAWLPSVAASDEKDSKRLLLTDPDVILARMTAMEKTIQQLTQTVTTLETELKTTSHSNHGSTYIRWGRKQCSTLNTETVYSGFSSGQEYSHGSYHGGPSNNLCLPNDPEISNKTAPGSSVIYGSEFENGNFFGSGAQDEDVPCAFCRSTNTTTTAIFPGRISCYAGWKMEYSGILASGCLTCKASSYICMDTNPEYLQGGERNNNENLFYATTTKCGSLPCPPYVSNRAVNCVVCSI